MRDEPILRGRAVIGQVARADDLVDAVLLRQRAREFQPRGVIMQI